MFDLLFLLFLLGAFIRFLKVVDEIFYLIVYSIAGAALLYWLYLQL